MDSSLDEKLPERLFSTWITTLIVGSYTEVAALVIDGSLAILDREWDTTIYVEVPAVNFAFVVNNTDLQATIHSTLRTVAAGHFFDRDGNVIGTDGIVVSIRSRLIDVENAWRDRAKELIVNTKDANQGVVTEKVFARESKEILLYNEMKFASQSEIRIAQELEKRKVLFFPLPLAVRHNSGTRHLDHRAVDFIVCDGGTWGILEVAYHPNRWEQDSEKDLWFKKSGILCIHHATAESCFKQPSKVVDDFLGVLLQHKK